MERLTEKNINGRCYGYDINTSNIESSIVIEGIALKNCVNKLGKLEDIEENRNIDILLIFKSLEEGFWMKEDCCFLKGDELERFKHKNSSYYDEENKLIFCPGVKADTDRVIHAKPSLGVTLLDGKITYFLSLRIGYVLLKDYGKTWALTKEELEK